MLKIGIFTKEFYEDILQNILLRPPEIISTPVKVKPPLK